MYRYETHLHTVESSACGATPGREYPAIFRDRGYDGIFITDHFFHGNTRPSRDLPWPDYVDAYMKGYEEAKKAGDAIGFKVFFGIEENFDGDEYLLYGVEKDWLLAHPALLSYSRAEVYAAVHEGGGIMVHAHPYRERMYLRAIHLTPSVSDAIEVFNAGNEPYQNALDLEYARELGLPMTSGSDIHGLDDHPMGGMLFDRRLESVQDYARAVITREGTPVFVHAGSITPVMEIPEQSRVSKKPYLPVFRH